MTRGKANQKGRGFTVLEILAVLVLLGLLMAVGIPKYLELAEDGRMRAAQGQIAAAKGRLQVLMGEYLLVNRGLPPLDGLQFMDYVTLHAPTACPGLASVEGAFEFQCEGSPGATSVVVTVSAVQGRILNPAVFGSFSF